MKTTFLLIFTAAIIALLTGCSGLSTVVRELSNDPATVRVKFIAPGYSFELDRSFPTNWTPPAPKP